MGSTRRNEDIIRRNINDNKAGGPELKLTAITGST